MAPSRGHSRALRTAALAAAVVALSLLACEGALRLIARRDASGQQWLGSLRLLPYQLPLDDIRANLDRLRAGDTFLAYDAELGWSPRPHARSTTGPFRVNGDGIRAEREIALEPPPGTLRVAVFGDSFAFGDEVGPDDTWATALERGLRARGVAAEVLNFGVNGYGMDQAYLRWRRDGRRFRPGVVVFAFQPENVLRNLNVFRPLYYAGTEVPLSKPRFFAGEEALELLNVPALPPDELLRVLEAMPQHPLFAYEGFYAPWYERHWWLSSRFAAGLATVTIGREAAQFRLDPEGRELARRLVTRFATEVAAHGAAFVVVHLPRRENLEERRAGRSVWYDALLHEDLAPLGVVDPTSAVATVDPALFAPRGHYSPALNAIVGAALVEPVLRATGMQRGTPAKP